ncbi:hypothetical protein [Mycobacterium sp.]|uniref:hypothetical protein n=1 Tax=Mycobacterium sp. TaxID=1785 RepID=UPI003F99F163
MSTTTVELTDEQLEEAILAALAPSGEELMPWTVIRHQVPGEFWAKERAMLRLHEAGKVYHLKLGGRPYVGLGDELDRQIAARYKAQGRVRGVLVA